VESRLSTSSVRWKVFFAPTIGVFIVIGPVQHQSRSCSPPSCLRSSPNRLSQRTRDHSLPGRSARNKTAVLSCLRMIRSALCLDREC
jgi:hypothetical protein